MSCNITKNKSKNRFQDYYKAASNCGGCNSNTKPFDVNQSYMNDLPFSQGKISGASEYSAKASTIGGNIYGAQFQEAKDRTKNHWLMPYQYTVHTTTVPPWYGAGCNERAFMNMLKADNQPPIKTYKQLKLLPTQRNARVEGFNIKFNNNLLVLILILVLFICMNK